MVELKKRMHHGRHRIEDKPASGQNFDLYVLVSKFGNALVLVAYAMAGYGVYVIWSEGFIFGFYVEVGAAVIYVFSIVLRSAADVEPRGRHAAQDNYQARRMA